MYRSDQMWLQYTLLSLWLIGSFWKISCVVAASNMGAQQGCCEPGQSCWPNSQDINELANALGPDVSRDLRWFSLVPSSKYFSKDLYDYASKRNLDPVYVQSQYDHSGVCYVDVLNTFCTVSSRDVPWDGWTPAFVVWPTTTNHIQIAVR